MIRLAEHFYNGKHAVTAAERHRRFWFIEARRTRERREQLDEQAEDDFASFAISAVMASDQQIEMFEAKLNAYDEATVKALLDNQKKLDEVNARLSALLARAHVMGDGRRVFRTQDGAQVFDEFGVEVKPNELDFSLISPSSPTWEKYQPDLLRRQQLELERQRILEFQEKVDAARDRTADGKIPKSELDDLDADLEASMPRSVKAQMPGHVTTNAPDLKTEFRLPAQTSRNAVGFTFDPRMQL